MAHVLDETAPLYEIKANLFKALAHPVRIRVLELLCSDGTERKAVAALLEETGLEASHLSSHLAVLRRHGVVSSERVGSTVYYRVAHPRIVEILAIARSFLTDQLDLASTRHNAVAALPRLGDPSPPTRDATVSREATS